LALPIEEIDLARGLFLTQLGGQELKKIRTYEVLIDLMALQIRARLPDFASPQIKIRAMNDFIFSEMGFRFPPHSIYAADIDLYTFLPSVLDSRRGVCLGVSILYICLAQRLDLPLEMITPPGHIYVRYRDKDKEINIETTARGIHMNSEEYLSIDTRALQQRNIKEVIGLAHFNQASVHWQQEKYEDALVSYEKAKKYLPDDKLLIELMGYNYLFLGKIEEGTNLLKQVEGYIPPYAVNSENVAVDFLKGAVDVEGLKSIFMKVDETRESIIEKRNSLQKTLDRCPKFRDGWFCLAVAWLQLHRYGEALKALEQHHQLESNDPTGEYYLSMLYAERFDFNKSWKHFKHVEELLKAWNHNPKSLKALRRHLTQQSPE
jgi:regulator of sirC expression with transglutaminase-like and TPR domain